MNKISVLKIPVLFLLGWLTILSQSCKDPINAASNTPAPTEAVFDSGYLSFCNEFFDGVESVEVEITVDALTGDMNELITEFYNNIYVVGNDDMDNDNLRFEIDVPDSGTFMVSASVRNSCSFCCDSSNTGTGDCNNGSQNGRPRFRGTSTAINQSPPPLEIPIAVAFQSCFSCGCTD